MAAMDAGGAIMLSRRRLAALLPRALAAALILITTVNQIQILKLQAEHQRHQPSQSESAEPDTVRTLLAADAAIASDEQSVLCSERQLHLGRIGVMVAFVTASYAKHYRVAQQTLTCYIERTGYELFLVDLDLDKEVKEHCPHTDLFYRKHCAASVYAAKVDWLLVLDADTGVANPAHCLHEYIDPAYDVILYERLFNWEIASGNYLVRNTMWARQWLRTWADYQFNQPGGFTGADNGALQLHVLRTVLPEAINEHATCDRVWRAGQTYETYMEYVTCCKVFRGARYEWPDKRLKIFKLGYGVLHICFRRGHGWVVDWFITNDRFCPANFMYHGWKANEIGEKGWDSPFTRAPNGSDCEPGAPWPHRPNRIVSCASVKRDMLNTEANYAKGFPVQAVRLPYVQYSDIGHCWPRCHTHNSSDVDGNAL